MKLDEKTKDFIINTYRKELNQDAVEINKPLQEFEQRYYTLWKNEADIEEVKKHVENDLKKFDDLELFAVQDFFESLGTEIVEKNDDYIDEQISPAKKHALQLQLENSSKNEALVKIDDVAGTQNLKQTCEDIYYDTGKKCFIISNQRSWNGKITLSLSTTQESFELVKIYNDGDDEKIFKHFGESNPGKNNKIIDRYAHSFYQYKFLCNDKEYLVLSEEKLEPGRCVLKGTRYKINDYKDVGDNRKLAVDREIIFAHSVEPAIQKLSMSELKELRKGLNSEAYSEKLLGEFRQPEWYEDLLKSITATNNDYGYPSHLIEMAEEGTGKSAKLESLAEAFGEGRSTFTGSASTIKGLVPSFKESPPDEGYLMKQDRLAAIDEGFNLLSNTVSQQNSSRQDVFRPMLDLLEHKTKQYKSGNGSIEGMTDALVLLMGNPCYGINSLMDAHEELDSAFLSRFISYDVLESHKTFVHNRKHEISNIPEEERYPGFDEDFLSIVDTLRDMFVELDTNRVSEIHKDLREIVPSGIVSQYDARYMHHMKNVVAGLAKVRFVTENRDDLQPEDCDYEDMKNIFETVILSWGDVEMSKLSFSARKKALTHAQRHVYELVNNEPGVDGATLFKRASSELGDDVSMSWLVTQLKNAELIVKTEDDGRKHFYPYWTEEYKEVMQEKEQTYKD